METTSINWKTIEKLSTEKCLVQVSNLGKLRKMKFLKKYEYPKIENCKLSVNKYGYLYLNLNGKNYFVHRLVAQAFIPNPNNLPQVNHIDEDKTNNRVDNLEWCSAKYNINFGTRKKRQSYNSSACINVFDKDGSYLFSAIGMNYIADELKISRSSVSACCRGIQKITCGYRCDIAPERIKKILKKLDIRLVKVIGYHPSVY